MRHAFSVIEIIVVICIIVLLILILLPALGSERRTRSMQSNTQVRGIQSSLVLYAAGNNNWYAGLDETGKQADLTGDGIPDGFRVEKRFEELLEEQYFTGEYIISPGEVKAAWTSGETLQTSNYSFALLAIDDDEERVEWRDTINTEALVVSDRAATGTGPDDITSVWTTDPGDWRGQLAWNDNHVEFAQTHRGYTTKYGEHVNKRSDDIFRDDGVSTGDAIMAFEGERGIFPR